MIHVSREFTPMTIRINNKNDAELIEHALELLLREAEAGRSKWFGLYRDKPTGEERETAQSIRNMLTAINPHRWINKPLFSTGL